MRIQPTGGSPKANGVSCIKCANSKLSRRFVMRQTTASELVKGRVGPGTSRVFANGDMKRSDGSGRCSSATVIGSLCPFPPNMVVPVAQCGGVLEMTERDIEQRSATSSRSAPSLCVTAYCSCCMSQLYARVFLIITSRHS